MSLYVAQATAMLVMNVIGIGILIWILVMVRQQNNKFDQIRKEIKLLNTAREEKEKL